MNDNFTTDPNIIPFPVPNRAPISPPEDREGPGLHLYGNEDQFKRVVDHELKELQKVCLLQQQELVCLRNHTDWLWRVLAMVGGLFVGEILSKLFL